MSVETVHSSTGTYFPANPSIRLVETSFLATGNSVDFFRVFSASENYYWNVGEIAKTKNEIYSG